MIVGFIGSQGSGKTLSGTNITKQFYEKGNCLVISNIPLDVPCLQFNEEMLKSKDFIEDIRKEYNPKTIVMFIDEIHMVLHSHKSLRDSAKTFFITQARKLLQHGHFIYTTQYYRQINPWLRDNTQLVIYVQKAMQDGEIGFQWDLIKDHSAGDMRGYNSIFIPERAMQYGLYDRFGIVDISESYLEEE